MTFKSLISIYFLLDDRKNRILRENFVIDKIFILNRIGERLKKRKLDQTSNKPNQAISGKLVIFQRLY